jgi:hypothetical protein
MLPDNMEVCFFPFQFFMVNIPGKLTALTKEPARKRLKSDSKDQLHGTIAKTSVIPQSVIHELYSESVAAKLWNVASRAVGKVLITPARKTMLTLSRLNLRPSSPSTQAKMEPHMFTDT